jgi:D-amino-acid dehydrogenase
MIVPSHFIPLAAPGAVALGLRWMFNPESPFWVKPRWDLELFDWGWKFWRAANREQVRRAAPLLRDMHLASRNYFEELARATKRDFGLVQRGLLMLCKTAHAFEEESRAAEEARALGIAADVLDRAQAAKLDPAIRMEIAGAVYFPKDCHLSPHLLMQRLKDLVRESGVRILYDTEAREVRREGAKIRAVVTNRDDMPVDELVLCGGSWSPALARELDLKLPMQAGKGYSLTLENPPQLPSICAILTEARIAVTPMGPALRIGGTMEIAGLNEDINTARVRGIIKAVPQYYPEFQPAHFAGVQPWRGLRPCSPDGLPYLGRTRRYKNMIVATGHAMMGLSLGPVSGKLVSELLSHENPSINIQLLDPDRYA